MCVCVYISEWRGQLSSVHHLLPPLPSDAIGQAVEQRGGHPHLAVDLHQVAAGLIFITTVLLCYYTVYYYVITPVVRTFSPMSTLLS